MKNLAKATKTQKIVKLCTKIAKKEIRLLQFKVLPRLQQRLALIQSLMSYPGLQCKMVGYIFHEIQYSIYKIEACNRIEAVIEFKGTCEGSTRLISLIPMQSLYLRYRITCVRKTNTAANPRGIRHVLFQVWWSEKSKITAKAKTQTKRVPNGSQEDPT